jgi:hypothetical protein
MDYRRQFGVIQNIKDFIIDAFNISGFKIFYLIIFHLVSIYECRHVEGKAALPNWTVFFK